MREFFVRMSRQDSTGDIMVYTVLKNELISEETKDHFTQYVARIDGKTNTLYHTVDGKVTFEVLEAILIAWQNWLADEGHLKHLSDVTVDNLGGLNEQKNANRTNKTNSKRGLRILPETEDKPNKDSK